MFVGISQTNLGRFSWNLIHGFPNKFAIKWCKSILPHLNNVSTLPCKTWNAHYACATIEVMQKETPEFIPLNYASKFARFDSSWLQSVRNIAREDVKNTHHWSRRTDERSGISWITSSLWQPSVSGVIDSSRSVMHVLYTFLQYSPHAVINWIQILRIWTPQLRWDKFWSFPI